MTTPAGLSRPWDGEAYSIKRHGLTIENCDSEPVRTPGCIQAHGVLLVVRLADLTILQASEGLERWFGRPAEALLGQPVASVLGVDAEARVRDFLQSDPTEGNPMFAVTIEARDARPRLDLIVHTIDGVAILELEPTVDDTDAREPDILTLLRRAVVRPQAASTLREFCQAVTVEVRALTSFDRVMVYKFHEDGHGEVFAESRASELTSWLGLHYPAQDIPQPAREIFSQIWIRPVPDVAGELAELVPLVNPDTGRPLTMTHCVLRGPSVMYTEYLQNMGVKGGLTLSLRRDGVLWGLIACHHYSGPAFVSHRLRASCEVFAQVMSVSLRAAEDREHFEYRSRLSAVHERLVAAAVQEQHLATLTEGESTLVDGIECGGAAVQHSGRWWCVGNTPTNHQLEELALWLDGRDELASASRPAYVSSALASVYPPADAFAGCASGLIATRLSRSPGNYLLWFRPEVIQSVTWGGDPDDKPLVHGPHGPRLTPRRSFELFVESVKRQAQPWLPVEINAALHFRLLVLELVVDQAERLRGINRELAASNDDLDSFVYVASHDLKEPLRGIHKYAHQLLEDATLSSEEQRQKVERLAALTLRMDSLLGSLLEYSRAGRVALELTDVDLSEVVDDAVALVEGRRTDRPTDIVRPRPLPIIRCNRVAVREIFANLLSNALKYNARAVRRVEVGHVTPGEGTSRGDAPPGTSGRTVFFVRDNGIGIEARHRQQVFKMFRRLHARDEFGGGTGAGLAIVQKLVDRHHGRVWLESVPGAGTTFFFTLEGS